MIYVIPGDPLPLARAKPNYSARRMYDAQSSLKLIYSIHVQRQHGDLPIINGPVHLDATFFMKIPNSNMTHKKYILNGPHFVKPDIDNNIKLILDISNNIIYKDDAQICSITARKVYDKEPRTEFSIIPLSNISQLMEVIYNYIANAERSARCHEKH